MTDYFVAAGGSNTSPYDTWAKAATSLQTALTAATGDGDRVIIQYNGVPSVDAEVSANTTYNLAGNTLIISSTNSGTADITPTPMGTSYWIGNSTQPRTITIDPVDQGYCYIYGITIRTAGSSAVNIYVNNASAGAVAKYESCYFWSGSTTGTPKTVGATGAATAESFTHLKNCTFRYSVAGGSIQGGVGLLLIEGGSFSASSTALTVVFDQSAAVGNTVCHGLDLTYAGTTSSYLLGNQSSGRRTLTLSQCKLFSGFLPLEAQASCPYGNSAEIEAFDCSSGDTHYHLFHATTLGSTTISTGIYCNDYMTDAPLSWKVISSSTASFTNPYISPWIDVYHTGTSAITPYLETMRDNASGTAYTNEELWSEWAYKGTSGSSNATIVSDKKVFGDSPANQTASSKGASDWTGESGTPAYMILAPTSSITPAEAGHIRARVVMGVTSGTVYVDPQIRGLT